MSSRTKMRRTRLRMLFEEFQNEILNLEERLDKSTCENAKLKAVNEELRLQVDSSSPYSSKDNGETEANKANGDISSTGDISTIIKLSNKLQEMVHANENLQRANAALRKDLKSLTSEREAYLQDLIKLREESKFGRSPNPYPRYNVPAMKEKMEHYDRERHQWKTDVKRSDDHINVEMSKDLDKFHRVNQNGSVSAESGQFNENHHAIDNRRKRSNAQHGSSSATEALQKLVSKVEPTPTEPPPNDEEIMARENGGFKSPLLDVTNDPDPTTSTSSPTDDVQEGEKSSNNPVLFNDPVRFPACVKLLELTKARQTDEVMQSANNSPTSESGKHYNPVSSPDSRSMLFWNNGMAFSNGCRSGGSPAVHHRPASNCENRSSKGEMDDDITIVLPSSDHPLIQNTPDSDNPPHNLLFQSPRGMEGGFRTRPDQLLSPSSESSLTVSTTNGVGFMPPTSHQDYQYYQSNSFQGSHYVPHKKVKLEESEKLV